MTTLSAARPAAARRRTIRGRLAARGLGVLAAVLRRLPQGLLHRGADLAGGVLYRVQPERRRLVADNLQRVCRYLVAHDMAGRQATRAAADGQALARLVRQAFGHYVRSYLESAALPAYASPERLARIRADDPAKLDQVFPDGVDNQLILISMHFGAIEIPGLWATRMRGLSITVPMETVADPDLQDYFERTRGESGLNVIPLAGAASALRAALAAGDSIALVSDRPVGGSGTPVELFGAPARLPAGPALLALETGVPAWLAATRRVGFGDYRTRFERIEVPADGSRRERLNAFMAAEAAAFERAVADAPEQWWTLFFPIWESAA